MAQTVHLKLVIAGNEIEGECTSLGRENSIECLSFRAGVMSPIDTTITRVPVKGGRTTGRHQHSPITILKKINKSSPLILKALCQNERIDSAEFQFYRTDMAGSDENFFTILVENGFISKVEQISQAESIEGHMDFPVEEVEISYSRIKWTSIADSIEYADNDLR